jgi:IS5 family transposase
MRKSIEWTAKLCVEYNNPGWRQYAYTIKRLKTAELAAQRSKRSKTKDRENKIKKAHEKYLHLSQKHLCRLERTNKELKEMENLSIQDSFLLTEIENFIKHAKRQIDQTTRRVINEEKIPHAEKVFSLFEPHTELINKGKLGIPVELGVRVCVVEDQHQFILHHEVMQKKVDQQVALPITEEVKKHFPSIASISFDKGYFSTDNRENISKIMKVSLPKKGKLSEKDSAIETSEDFLNSQKKHSAIESAIHALIVHGLDRCLDHGINGLNRYVALSVLARNIHRIGEIIRNKERRLLMLREKRKKKKCA